jgi:glycosyltransferase involved in cell wall biosynthesis
MNLVLLMLSGDAVKARETVGDQYPLANVKIITRQDLGTGSFSSRLAVLRRLKPDVFVIATEKLSWQRGSTLLMVFGALGGAGEVVMIDAHGGWNRASRVELLLKGPARLAAEGIASARSMNEARRELSQFENSVGRRQRQPIKGADLPRVIYLRSTPGPGTQTGGASSHIKGVVEALVDLGAEVEVISNDEIAGLDKTNIPITVLQPNSFGNSRALFDINSNSAFTRAALPLIQKFRPDIIYQRYARFGWTGVAASLQTGRPLFLEYNGSEVWVGRHWDHVGNLDLLERYERLNLSGASRIFVVSEVERRNLEAASIEPEKIVVNPNGVDPNVFRPGSAGEAVRKKFGFRSGEVVVGFVGTFGPWHGVGVLTEAIKSIPNSLKIRFLMVGTGSLHAEVEQRLQTECESGRVIFTGAVEHEQVPKLLDACDILVAPHVPLEDGSEFFGSPTKLFEYMAMGKAIVASRLGQIGDILENEVTALLVEPGKVDQLAAAIMKFAGSAEVRVRVGTKAREVAIQQHTWRHNAERVLLAYRSIVETN